MGDAQPFTLSRNALTTSQQIAGKKPLAGHAVIPVLNQLTTSLQWPFISSCDSPTNPEHEYAVGAFPFDFNAGAANRPRAKICWKRAVEWNADQSDQAIPVTPKYYPSRPMTFRSPR